MHASVLHTIVAAFLVVAASPSAEPQNNANLESIGNRDINAPALPAQEALSFEEEIELGRSLAADLESHVALPDRAPVNTLVATGEAPEPVTLSDDALITGYVDRIGQRLAATSDARVPFTFRVIEDWAPNGLALPGGFVYVNAGLITAAESEAELASALATLIAHVAARHGIENQASRGLLDAGTVPLVFVGSVSGVAAARAGGIAIPAAVRAFSRGAVEEADFLGVQYLYTAGYEAEAAARLLDRIVDRTEVAAGSASRIFMTHPPVTERAKQIRRTIAKVLPARETNVVTTPEFEGLRERLTALELTGEQ